MSACLSVSPIRRVELWSLPRRKRAESPSSPFIGTWRAILASPGGELPFTLRVRADAAVLSAVAVNGDEQAAFQILSRVDLPNRH